jgi:para-nitrobenzyl esterase
LLGVAGVVRAQSPPVRIESGLLQGVREGDAVAYKGVPYAAPPVGPLRWRPPQPAARWPGVREASEFGAVCPQGANRGRPAGAKESEDCLTLNVWTPARPAGAAPVMVWLHGGGDDQGAASQPQFDGAPFARDGVVFVSVEYRLGVLGWFAHPALTREAAPGAPLANYGPMDEIAALKWVRRNIRAFGGDPSRVTAAGESAGGEAVLFLLTTPAARGLFAQAIVESGTGWADYPTLASAERQGAALAERAGAPANADAAALRALPVTALVAANTGGVGPVLDGRLLKRSPADAFRLGASAQVPLLIGSNSGEDNMLGQGDPAAVLKDYPAGEIASLRAAYGPGAPDDATLGRDILRDDWMGAPARWIAARQAAKAPVFLYQFDYVPEARRRFLTRAGHGSEMLFVFQALDRAPVPLRAITERDRADMAMVHACWGRVREDRRSNLPQRARLARLHAGRRPADAVRRGRGFSRDALPQGRLRHPRRRRGQATAGPALGRGLVVPGSRRPSLVKRLK